MEDRPKLVNSPSEMTDDQGNHSVSAVERSVEQLASDSEVDVGCLSSAQIHSDNRLAATNLLSHMESDKCQQVEEAHETTDLEETKGEETNSSDPDIENLSDFIARDNGHPQPTQYIHRVVSRRRTFSLYTPPPALSTLFLSHQTLLLWSNSGPLFDPSEQFDRTTEDSESLRQTIPSRDDSPSKKVSRDINEEVELLEDIPQFVQQRWAALTAQEKRRLFAKRSASLSTSNSNVNYLQLPDERSVLWSSENYQVERNKPVLLPHVAPQRGNIFSVTDNSGRTAYVDEEGKLLHSVSPLQEAQEKAQRIKLEGEKALKDTLTRRRICRKIAAAAGVFAIVFCWNPTLRDIGVVTMALALILAAYPEAVGNNLEAGKDTKKENDWTGP